MSYEFKVWVGCMACYNAGMLNGEWVEPEGAEDWECPISAYEETWVYDVDTDIPTLAEEMSPSTAKAIGEALAACDEAGYPPRAYALWCANVGEKVVDWINNEDSFTDSYRGECSLQDYAEELFDDLYLHEIPEHVWPYIDHEKFARDLECEGYWESHGYVFGP